jgi:uncharacterized repeat protein (TIGR01451 family)
MPDQNPPLLHRWQWVTGILLALGVLSSGTRPAYAEGSRTLYPTGATGSRANNEWATDRYGPTSGPGGNNSVIRRTLLRVYAEAGERILLGSSANGVNTGRIYVYNPGAVTGQIGQETVPTPSASNFTCPITGSIGRITSRALELAGPRSADGTGNLVGYVPCVFVVPTTGLYSVVITGPSGFSSASGGSPTGEVALTSASNFDSNQGTTISAWDVTVRSSNPSSITDINGRVFTYVLSLFTGNNGRPLNAPVVYPVTLDGYIYRTAMNGLDPNGFVIYGNQLGYLDTDGRLPLYRDVIGITGGAALTTLAGGVNFAPPQFPLFLNNPYINPNSTEILLRLGIPLFPVVPQVTPGTFRFNGTAGNNNSTVNTGGTFTFTSNISGTYEIIISRDGSNFDPTATQNRLLRGVMAVAGSQNIAWDGRANDGTPFPVGTNYTVRFNIRGGEYHFPLLDAENSTRGGPSFTLQNPPAPHPLGSNSFGFYDDRSYRTLNGTIVDPGDSTPDVNEVLCGSNPPAIAFDLVDGFDTTGTQRAFGATSGGNTNTTCTGSFGDVKGLDIWTYFPSNLETTTLNVVVAASSLTVDKTVVRLIDADLSNSTTPGDTLQYTIAVNNGSSAAANRVVLTDPVPTGTTYVPGSLNVATEPNVGAKSDSVGNDQAEINGSTIRFRLGTGADGSVGGTLAAGTSTTVTFQVRINETFSGTQVSNQAVLSGTNFTSINSNDPVTPVVSDPTITSLSPRLRLVKRLTAIDSTTLTRIVDDLNDIDDNSSVLWPANYLQGEIFQLNLQPVNEVEYTIYFLSDGGIASSNVRLCDRLPSNTAFVATAYNRLTQASNGLSGVDRGIAVSYNGSLLSYTNANDGDTARFYWPGESLPAVCGTAQNTTGAIVVNLGSGATPSAGGSLPNATTPGTSGSYGFVRFKVRIN